MSYIAQMQPAQESYHKVPEREFVSHQWAPVQQQLLWMPNAMSRVLIQQGTNLNSLNEQIAVPSIGKNVAYAGGVGRQKDVGDELKDNLTGQVRNPYFVQNKENANSNCYRDEGQQIKTSNFTPEHQPQNNMAWTVRADQMTVEQTASWIRTLGNFNGWQEADKYAWSFRQNDIWGWLLQKLNLDSLKTELGVVKYGHRLQIMAAIKCLFPAISRQEGEVKKMEYNQVRSPMSVTQPEAKAEEMDVSPKHSYASPLTVKSTKRGASLRSDTSSMESNPSTDTSTKTRQQMKEVLKWVSQKTGDRMSQIKELSRSKCEKISRASPGNPISYVALRKVKVRSGKSIHSDLVCKLPKGSVLVINQSKGRSGRVVLELENGKYEKLGWVTLYTHDNKQLFQKFRKQQFR